MYFHEISEKVTGWNDVIRPRGSKLLSSCRLQSPSDSTEMINQNIYDTRHLAAAAGKEQHGGSQRLTGRQL